MKKINIAPFGLPNCGPLELRFEEPRDIQEVIVSFKGEIPAKIALFYLNKTWPAVQVENSNDITSPLGFGWIHIDDWFNTKWKEAAVNISKSGAKVLITFKPLTAEFPKMKDYDVLFRRTHGIRIETPHADSIKNISVFTASGTASTGLRVVLDAGRKTSGRKIRLSAYNSVVKRVKAVSGVKIKDGTIQLLNSSRRVFEVTAAHMTPCHKYSNDDGHIMFGLDDDIFTISLESLTNQGPIWFAEKGVFITRSDDKRSFPEYLSRIKGKKTISEMVKEEPEQCYSRAFLGQPRPHAVSYNVGCKNARQRFWLEPNGDVFLNRWNIESIKGKDTSKFKNNGSARFFFGLGKWIAARFSDPSPVLAYNIILKHDSLMLEHKSFAVPLEPVAQDKLNGDDTVVLMARFRFTNTDGNFYRARLPVSYSGESERSFNIFQYNWFHRDCNHDDYMVPASKLEKLEIKDKLICGRWNDESVIRACFETDMQPGTEMDGVAFTKNLEPGQSCEIILKIPFISLESAKELAYLNSLEFEKCYRDVVCFWQAESSKGASVITPEPNLNALYASHLSHVHITDLAMPENRNLINTSAGTSTYGNYSNESCMIIHELDQRGLHREARKRLNVWLRYQGTAAQSGNFTDFKGMFFGAGGFESGASYNQHHGWVLWCLCEHYFLTGDDKWFEGIADSVIAGAEWVFRQRKNTMRILSHSRGWEYGFLPAGSLEDVADFFYWLSTNALTWRGVEWSARALEKINHPESKRIRKEADAYKKDLIEGFETMRRHTPLVKLENGRWTPNYPGRLYNRGRDTGWIREVLEGSVYLILSELYEPCAREAQWILDDFQDNRYIKPPYGYIIPDFKMEWFYRGGFSMQPNLLAGLLPYLIRDEVDIYIWMFFNAFCACYREEITAMVEHPWPTLGYSNSAHFKTSDEANSVNWLRYMYVFTYKDLLHLGRAIPRKWLDDGNTIKAIDVATIFGKAGITFHSQVNKGKIIAEVSLELREKPGKILVRFRHPGKLELKSVSVNGKKHKNFDPVKGDVDITGYTGEVEVEALYKEI